MSKRPPGQLPDVMCAKRNCISLSIKDKVEVLNGTDSAIYNMNENSDNYSDNNHENFSVEAKISVTER
jgi:hypothetical protein